MRVARKKIINLTRRVVPLLFLVVVISASAQAASVRGRLDRRSNNGSAYPAAYVAVTLYRSDLGRSAPVYTGTDGMYYFNNVRPGDYYLEVWLYPSRPPVTYLIRVNDPGTNIPPIQIS